MYPSLHSAVGAVARRSRASPRWQEAGRGAKGQAKTGSWTRLCVDRGTAVGSASVDEVKLRLGWSPSWGTAWPGNWQAEVFENMAGGGRVADGSKHHHPAIASGAGQDVVFEHPANERRPIELSVTQWQQVVFVELLAE